MTTNLVKFDVWGATQEMHEVCLRFNLQFPTLLSESEGYSTFRADKRTHEILYKNISCVMGCFTCN